MEVQVLSPAHKTLGPDAEHWGLYVLVVRSDLKDGPSPSTLGLGSRVRKCGALPQVVVDTSA